MDTLIDSPRVPVIDLSLFEAGDPWRDHLAAQIDWAGSTFGVFQLIGHGVDPGPGETLIDLGRKFLGSQANEVDELSFGSQSAAGSASRCRHNHFPDLPGFRDAVHDYMTAVTGLGHKLMTTIARGLGLHDGYFVDRYTGNPTTLLRVLSCRSLRVSEDRTAEQRLLTFTRQDEAGGLQISCRDRWVEVPVVPGALVCCVGSVLRRMTDGHYMAVATRLSNSSVRDRLSLTFSFDPSPDFLQVEVGPLQTGTLRGKPWSATPEAARPGTCR